MAVVHASVRASFCLLTFSLNIFFSETTHLILMKFHRNVLPWSSSEFLERILFLQKLWLPWQQDLTFFEIFENLLVRNHKAYSYQIWHVTLPNGSLSSFFKIIAKFGLKIPQICQTLFIFFKACEQRKNVPKGITNDLGDIITMVIQVFVDSYPHIPRHRRQLLFNKLLSVIGEGQYLWRTLLLMLEMVVTKGTLKYELAADTQEVRLLHILCHVQRFF